MATVTVLTLRWACLVVLTSLARLEDHDDDDDDDDIYYAEGRLWPSGDDDDDDIRVKYDLLPK